MGGGAWGDAVTVAAALYTNRIPRLSFFHFRFFQEHVALCAPNSLFIFNVVFFNRMSHHQVT